MSDRDPLDRNFLDDVSGSRRDFLKKMAAVAFAAPVISVFTMDSAALAGERGPRHRHPNQTYGNQTRDCEQHFPNQTYGNQTFPGHWYGNQTYHPRPRPWDW